jgi:hypothetical protein
MRRFLSLINGLRLQMFGLCILMIINVLNKYQKILKNLWFVFKKRVILQRF